MSVRTLLAELILMIVEGDDDRIKRGATPDAWRSNVDNSFEASVEDLMDSEWFVDVNTFINAKLENDDYSFSTVELQALSRNVDAEKLGHRVSLASPITTKKIRTDLEDMGFTFVARQPARHFRGSMSSGHGTHPFAGSGGGGSGFGSGFGGTTFTSFGGGPGAIGSGEKWDANDPKNLTMGSKRKKR